MTGPTHYCDPATRAWPWRPARGQILTARALLIFLVGTRRKLARPS
ncbi:MAG: hypothetical protein ACRDS0_34040 [Pseudonocardiaceae bacterium]